MIILFRYFLRYSYGLFNICAMTWVDFWIVADYRWRQCREARTCFRHGIGWLFLLFALKAIAMENLAPQPSQWVGRLGSVLQYRRCNASLNSISERHGPLTYRSHLPISWLLRMMRLVIGSVMCLSSCSLQDTFGRSDYWFCCCHGLRMLSCLKGFEMTVFGTASPEYFTGMRANSSR